jgi:single-stranded-DNA-specific exonuclease
MPDPSIFRDMDKAAERLADAVEAGEPVTIFGDYDVDGATSAALLILLLRQLGADPQAYIPDRLMEGYGPSGEALVRLAEGGAKLIVTVDCGAQAFEALAWRARRASTSSSSTITNARPSFPTPSPWSIPTGSTKRGGAAHGHLAAVGVAFLLGAALLRTLRGRGFFAGREEPKLIELLDLVALGTVADVAQLRGLNRAFVTQGLKVMAGAAMSASPR